MDYITYIDSILEFKAESYKKIEAFDLKIENNPYILSKKAGENSFIGQSEGKEFLIQIIESTNDTLPIYEIELEKRELMIEIVSGIKKSIHTVSGNIVIVNEIGRRVSLLDYLNYRSFSRIPSSLKENSKLSLDIIIKALLEIIRNIASAEKKNMSIYSLGLQDIYIEITETPIYPIFTIENYGIEIKIDPIGQTPFFQKYSVMTELALSLFSALREKPCENLDLYYSKIEEKINKYLKKYPYPVYDLIKLLLRENIKAEEVLFSKTFGTWIYLFHDYETIPIDHEFDSDMLLAGLYLKRKSNRIKSALTLVSQEKENLTRFIKSKPGKEENFRRIVNSVCRYKNWNPESWLFKVSISVLNTLVSSYSFLAAEAGPLKLYKALLLPHHDLELIHKICYNSTMTGPSIVYKSPLLDKIATSSYSFEILPFMGIKTFQCFYRLNSLKSIQKIEILGAVPIVIRRMNVKNSISFIDSWIENSDKETCFRVVFKAIQILRENLNEGKLAHECNKFGKCYKNEFSYNSSVLMAYCKKCNQYMCLVCGSSHADPDHSLAYVRSNKPCKKSSENLEIVKDLFEIKEISMSFFDSFGNSNQENTFSSEKNSEEISITTLEGISPIYDDSRHSTLLYYELEIIDAGFSENISIGIDGVEVIYSGNTGVITDSIGNLKQQASRFGTGDVVGIGLTSSHFLYFTINGYNLHIYIKCNDVQELRPLIKFKGKGIVVRVITSQFYFSLSTFNCSLSLQDPMIKSMINKWVYRLEIGEEDCKALNNSLKDVFDEDIAKPFDKKASKKIKSCDPCRIF